MKVLVTGATGFLGSHLVRTLQASGHDVVPFARSTGGNVLDGQSVRRGADGCIAAFHCAGRVSRRPEDAEDLYRLHVEGTKITLDACAEAGVKRVVVASTSGTVAVSDDPEHVGKEDAAAPIGIVSRWPYYRAKLFAERAALERNRPGFEVVSVNPSLLLGPGDVNGSSTQDVRLLLEGAVPAVPAGGLSFVDARDVRLGVEAIHVPRGILEYDEAVLIESGRACRRRPYQEERHHPTHGGMLGQSARLKQAGNAESVIT